MEGSLFRRGFRGDTDHVKECHTSRRCGRGTKSLELIFLRPSEHAIDDRSFVEGSLADQIAQDGIEVITLL